MGFVRYHRAIEIHKRNRLSRGKENALLHDSYDIAQQFQPDFSAVIVKAMRALLPDKMPPDFAKRFKTKNFADILEDMPFFTVGTDNPVWLGLLRDLESVYVDVIKASGQDATEKMNDKLGTKLTFTVLTHIDDDHATRTEIIKAAKKKKDRVITTPVNPYSVRWVKERALELITGGVSKPQIEIVKNILKENFAAGERVENVYAAIKMNIGLTPRDAQAVKNRLALHRATGMGDAQAHRLTEEYASEKLAYRAEMIGRTETITAQAQGRRDAWKVARDSGDLPEVVRVWIAAPPTPNPNAPCDICQDLDGKEADLDGYYESDILGEVQGSPAHPHCLPFDALVSPISGVSAYSKRPYNGDLVVISTASGHKLACTPNHLILGNGGWVKAKDVKLFDYVANSDWRKWKALINVNHDDSPSPIHEITETFGKSGNVSTVEVPESAEDFHGDGVDGQIAIIGANSLLANGDDSFCQEEISEFDLVSRIHGPVLFRDCLLAFVRDGLFRTPHGSMCRRCIQRALLLCSRCRNKPSCFRCASVTDPVLTENPSDNWAADSEKFTERLFRNPGLVSLDQVVTVDVCYFSGHVYNLQTGFNWYIAQGIINHNCGCSETIKRKESKNDPGFFE